MQDVKKSISVFSGTLVFSVLAFGALSYCQAPLASKLPALDPAVVEPAEKLGKAFEAVAQHVRPVVVSVFAEKVAKLQPRDIPIPFGDEFLYRFFGEGFGPPGGIQNPRGFGAPMRGMGSGILLEQRGAILTNHHVVNGFDEIKVQFADGAEYRAKVKGSDARSDVAVLEIKGKAPDSWIGATLGDSDQLKVGNLVLAVGAPFGLSQTVTQGVISATGRANVGITDYEDFIQTDTPINPGNSGGPLVNMRGEVIGVNTAIATGIGQYSGVGFAIPSNMVKAMLPSLLKGESITRGQLGIGIQDLNPELARQFDIKDQRGVLVGSVARGSAAEKAGIRVGDVVTSYAGKEVRDTGQLRNLVAGTAPGTRVKIGIVRDGTKLEIMASVGELQADALESASSEEADGVRDEALGIDAREIPPRLRQRLDEPGGVFVAGVRSGSAAAASGIQPDDVIIQVDRQSVRGLSDFRRLMRKAASKGSALLLVKRQGATIFVVVRKE